MKSTGSAHRGLGEWLVQRLSALYLAGFVFWLLARFGLQSFAGHAAWKAWMADGNVRLAFALFFMSLFLHAWVGVRSVLLDYLKTVWLRLLAQICLGVFLVACGFWAIQILLLDVVHT